MGLFGRNKQSSGIDKRQLKRREKYLVNVKDKKFRLYLNEHFDNIVKKEDVIKIMEELQWTEMINKIERFPKRKRIRILKYMAQHINDLEPDVKQNFIRYMSERYGVKVGEKR